MLIPEAVLNASSGENAPNACVLQVVAELNQRYQRRVGVSVEKTSEIPQARVPIPGENLNVPSIGETTSNACVLSVVGELNHHHQRNFGVSAEPMPVLSQARVKI